jgi:hypothetical protein
MIIVLVVVGAAIDSYLHDHSITFHYKVFGGLAGIGVTLFIARQLKNLFVRVPVKR